MTRGYEASALSQRVRQISFPGLELATGGVRRFRRKRPDVLPKKPRSQFFFLLSRVKRREDSCTYDTAVISCGLRAAYDSLTSFVAFHRCAYALGGG